MTKRAKSGGLCVSKLGMSLLRRGLESAKNGVCSTPQKFKLKIKVLSSKSTNAINEPIIRKFGLEA